MKKLVKIVGVTVLILAGILVYLVVNESPDRAFYRIQALANDQDWAGLYGQLSLDTQDELDFLAGMSRQYMTQLDIPGASDVSDAEVFSFAMTGSTALHPLFFIGEHEVLGIEREENRAVLQIRNIAQNIDKPAELVKELGLWKLDVRIE